MIFQLNNNAFFLQTTRERMRPAIIFSSILISGIILFLLSMNVMINNANYNSPFLELFWQMACAQGFLIFGVATWSTAQMSNRERNSGTLDFHRASPASAFSQTIGLLLGAPSLEWVIFLLTLPVSVFLAAASPIGLLLAIDFYIGFIVTAFLLHLMVIFLNLNNLGLEEASNKRLQNTPLLILGVFFFCILPFMFRGHYENNNSTSERVSSVTSHIIGSPGWQKIETMVNNINHPNRYDGKYRHQQMPHSYLFIFRVPEVFLQLIVQVPLIMLFALGIIRIIRIPHLAPLSKEQLLFGSMYIMFIVIADSFVNLSLKNKVNEGLFEVAGFITLVLALGYISAIMATPRRLTYSIGLRKMAQLNQKKMAAFDDHNSNGPWMICFAVIACAWFGFFFRVLPHEMAVFGFLILAIGLVQIGTFASAMEAFNLSLFGNRRILFAAGLSIPWIFLPIFVAIISPLVRGKHLLFEFGSSFSPFYLYNTFFSKIMQDAAYDLQAAQRILAINAVAFGVAFYMAHKQRLLVQEKA